MQMYDKHLIKKFITALCFVLSVPMIIASGALRAQINSIPELITFFTDDPFARGAFSLFTIGAILFIAGWWESHDE